MPRLLASNNMALPPVSTRFVVWIQRKWDSVPSFTRFLLSCGFSVIILLIVILMITYYLAAVSTRHHKDKFHIVISAEVLAGLLIVVPTFSIAMMFTLKTAADKHGRGEDHGLQEETPIVHIENPISFCTPSRRDIEVDLLRHIAVVFGIGCILYLVSEISDRDAIARNKRDLFVNAEHTVLVHGILWIVAICTIAAQVCYGLSPSVMEAMRNSRGSVLWKLIRILNMVTAILMIVNLLHDYFVLPEIHSFLPPPDANISVSLASKNDTYTRMGIHDMEFTLFAAVTGFDMHAFCGMVLISVMMGKRPAIAWTPTCNLRISDRNYRVGHQESQLARVIYALGRPWILIFSVFCLGFLFIAAYKVIPNGTAAEVLSMIVETITTVVALTLTWFMVGTAKFPKFNNVESFVMIPAIVAVTVLGCASVFRLISSDDDGLNEHHILELCYHLVQIICCLFQAIVVIAMAKSIWVKQAISRHAPLSDFNRHVKFRLVSAVLAIANVILWTANAFFDAEYLKEKILAPRDNGTTTTNYATLAQKPFVLAGTSNSTKPVLSSVWPSIQLWSVPWVVELYMIFAILYSTQYRYMNGLMESYYAVHALAAHSSRRVDTPHENGDVAKERKKCLLDITRIALRGSGAKQINYTGGTGLVMEVGEEQWDLVEEEFIHCVAVLTSYETCRGTLCADKRLLNLLVRRLPELSHNIVEDVALMSSLFRIFLNLSEDEKQGATYMSMLFRSRCRNGQQQETAALKLLFIGFSKIGDPHLDVSTLCLMLLCLLKFDRDLFLQKLNSTPQAYSRLVDHVKICKPSHKAGVLQLIVALLQLHYSEGVASLGVDGAPGSKDLEDELDRSFTILAEISHAVTSNAETVVYASFGVALLYNSFRTNDGYRTQQLEHPVRACVSHLEHNDERLQVACAETMLLYTRCLKNHPESLVERQACMDSIPILVQLCCRGSEDVRMYSFQALDTLLHWNGPDVGNDDGGADPVPQDRSQLRLIDLGLMQIKCQTWTTFLKFHDMATVNSVENLLLQCLEREALTNSAFIEDLREAIGEIIRSLRRSWETSRLQAARDCVDGHSSRSGSSHRVEIFTELPPSCALLAELQKSHSGIIQNLVMLHIELVFQNARRGDNIPAVVVSLLKDVLTCDAFRDYAADYLLLIESRVHEKRENSLESQRRREMDRLNALEDKRGVFSRLLYRLKFGLSALSMGRRVYSTPFCWDVLYILRRQISEFRSSSSVRDHYVVEDAFLILWEISSFPSFWEAERQFDIGNSFDAFTETLKRMTLTPEDVENKIEKWAAIGKESGEAHGVKEKVNAHIAAVQEEYFKARGINMRRIQGL